MKGGANIAVYSKNATRVYICLFDTLTGSEIFKQPLPEHLGDVHFGFVSGVTEGQHYGLYAEGPWQPDLGHHFDPSKLLLDPYATALSGSFHYQAELSRHGVASAVILPKAVATKPLSTLPLRKVPEPKLIYELNVRGFSMRNPAIAKDKRGTITALAEPASLAHFKRLGVDTVELMPIAAWIDERHLVNLGLRNAWGYNPISFFAVEPSLAPGGLQELRDTVTKLHAENINVILDVVFNHTGEGDVLGPMLSLQGLDNASYYRLFHGAYVNDTGCGNTLALDRPHTVQLVISAMRHWVLTCGIDGFRFDLATVMGRTESGFSKSAPLFEAIEKDPVLSSRILIAEPWDVGPGGYQLGNFPAVWYEWNDRFRDDVRRFWRGDAWSANALATRMTGSSDVFAGRKPSRSINFISAHDGFTLHDLLHFTQKINLANGENNRDGKSDEVTCNNSNALALLTTLLLSRGTPMIAAGDEFGRSQGGNNNAYAQDNETTWLDWNNRDMALETAFSNIAKARNQIASFLKDQFLTGQIDAASTFPDAVWLDAEGNALDWSRSDIRLLTLVLFSEQNRICICINGSHDTQMLNVKPRSNRLWRNLDGEAAGTIAAQCVAVFSES